MINYSDLKPGCIIQGVHMLIEREVVHVGTRAVTVRATGDTNAIYDYEIPRHIIEKLWEIKDGA